MVERRKETVGGWPLRLERGEMQSHRGRIDNDCIRWKVLEGQIHGTAHCTGPVHGSRWYWLRSGGKCFQRAYNAGRCQLEMAMTATTLPTLLVRR